MAKLSSTDIYGDLYVDGTIRGTISGNADTATKLATTRKINGTNFDGTANITTANWGTARNISIADSSATNTGSAVSVNGSGNVTLKLPATIKASLTGNASTATTLATARTINGTSFNGSGNITTANWGTARTITIGSTGKSVNGSGNVSWTLAEIGAAASSHGTHVSYGGNGSATTVSRSDHTHSYLPLTGGSVSGAVTSTIGGGKAGFIITNGTSRTMMYSSSNVGEHIFGGCNDSTDRVKDFIRIGANKLKYETGGASYDIYHAGNKPTPAAIGAAAASHGTHLTIGTGAENAAAGNHTHNYLPLGGGTMTGAITTPNNAQGIKVGDDAVICDRNIANHMVIEGATATSGGITFGSGLDTNIYRGAANQLKTDDAFYAVGEIISGSNVRSDTALTDNLGTAAIPWKTTCSKQVYLYGEASKRYGYLSTPTIGTTDTVGECLLVLGNETASGTASNATGKIYLYGTNTGGTYLTTAHTGTGTYTITLPAKSGTVALNNHTHNYAGSSSAGGTANSVNGLTFWTGTLSAYNALSSKSNTTVYLITG